MAFPRALDPTTYVVRLARGIRELGIDGDVVDPIVPPEKTVILISEMYGCDGTSLSGVSVSLDPSSYTPAAYPADDVGWADISSGKGLALLSEVDIGGMWPVYVKVVSKYVGDYVSYGFVSLHVGTWLRVMLKPRAEWPQWSQEFDSPP
jgi:hypothetical protein